MIQDNLDFGRYIEDECDTRWADADEISNSEYIKKIDIKSENTISAAGIPIISDGSSAHVDVSDAHSIIFGSTGSKKTRLFGMPTINLLAMAGESFIATDPKGELFEKTSGFVQMNGYNVYVLNFRELSKSDFWNPLALPYEMLHSGKTDEAVAWLNDLINSLSAPFYESTKDRYFLDLGINQFLANLLFFMETASPEEANFYSFTKFFYDNCTPKGTRELCDLVADGSLAAINFKSVLTNEEVERTFANVTSTVIPLIKPFIMRKELSQVISKSSFDIRNIANEKTAIYIIVPDEKTTYHFLVTMFIKQTYEVLIHEAQLKHQRQLPIRLNFILDEFANIPAIPDMTNIISAARSRNIRFFLMVQGMEQLYEKYDKSANTIKGNCDNWIFLNSREHKLLEEISTLCGEVTKKVSGNQTQKEPLISITKLQKLIKGWYFSEALIKYGRFDPYVSMLPDIDVYLFEKCPEINLNERKLPDIVLYNTKNVIHSIKNKRSRPIPFSKDVYGVDKFWGDKTESVAKKTTNNELFDW
jgi:type IV secretion system protein VirD4